MGFFNHGVRHESRLASQLCSQSSFFKDSYACVEQNTRQRSNTEGSAEPKQNKKKDQTQNTPSTSKFGRVKKLPYPMLRRLGTWRYFKLGKISERRGQASSCCVNLSQSRFQLWVVFDQQGPTLVVCTSWHFVCGNVLCIRAPSHTYLVAYPPSLQQRCWRIYQSLIIDELGAHGRGACSVTCYSFNQLGTTLHNTRLGSLERPLSYHQYSNAKTHNNSVTLPMTRGENIRKGTDRPLAGRFISSCSVG